MLKQLRKNQHQQHQSETAVSNVGIIENKNKRKGIGKNIRKSKGSNKSKQNETNVDQDSKQISVISNSDPNEVLTSGTCFGTSMKQLLDPNSETENPLRSVIDIIANPNHKNVTDDIEIYTNEGELVSTNIPNNVPVAVIGDKGSGKSTLITAIMEATHETELFRSIYYIYSSLTLDTETPPFVTRIDVAKSEEFLSNLFEIKSLFNSYSKLFAKLESDSIWNVIDNLDQKRKAIPDNEEKPKLIKNLNSLILQKFLDNCDNQIVQYNQQIVNSGLDPQFVIDKILTNGDNIVQKFSKPFYIGTVRIDGLIVDQRDAVIIDDIAIASNILFKQIKDNPIYSYLTLTRHMRLFILFAGQQIDQIPKSIRREIMCWIISKNTNLELLSGVISKQAVQQIQQKQTELVKYQFVIYNTVSGYIGII